jgi:uncharacterized membrane protein YfcA
MRVSRPTTVLVASVAVLTQVAVALTGVWSWGWLAVPLLGLLGHVDTRLAAATAGVVIAVLVAGAALRGPGDQMAVIVLVGLADAAAVVVGHLTARDVLRGSG